MTGISTYFAWIEKFLFPPGIKKPKLGRLYRVLGSLADGYASDRVWLLRQHFALTCEKKYLARLGNIFDLPRWSFESDESYRSRLIGAGQPGLGFEGRGSVPHFDWFMRGLFGDEWASNGEATTIFVVGHSVVGKASIGEVDKLRVGIKAVGAFVVGSSEVSRAIVGGIADQRKELELKKFLSWFLAADIAYDIYYL